MSSTEISNNDQTNDVPGMSATITQNCAKMPASSDHLPNYTYAFQNQQNISQAIPNVFMDELNFQLRGGDPSSRVYRCSRCGVDFPNAQAYGGHMSSHSKVKKKVAKVDPKTPTAGRKRKMGSSGGSIDQKIKK